MDARDLLVEHAGLVVLPVPLVLVVLVPAVGVFQKQREEGCWYLGSYLQQQKVSLN